MSNDEVVKVYVCDKCLLGFPRYQSLVMHCGGTYGKHKGEGIPALKDSERDELPDGYSLKEPPPKKGDAPPLVTKEKETTPPLIKALPKPPVKPAKDNVYKKVPEPSAILEKVLTEFPGLGEGVVKEIMSWVEYKGVLHPMEVAHLLSQMADVPKGAAQIIPQKYTLALNKAAQEGSADIHMILGAWGGLSSDYGGQPDSNMLFSPLMGEGTMFRRPPPFGIGYRFNPYSQYDPNEPYPGYRPRTRGPSEEAERKLDPAVAQRLESMEQLIQTLTEKIIETEEEKKAAVLSARLERIENALVALQTPSGTSEESTKSSEHFTALQGELVKLREDIATNKISALEKEISGLRTQLTDTNQARIERLEKELEETKELAQKPVTGRTEMDVVGGVIDKAVDKMADAGKDIKAIVMSGATREQFNPLRTKPSDIAKAGEKLAATIEKAAELAEREAKFVAKP